MLCDQFFLQFQLVNWYENNLTFYNIQFFSKELLEKFDSSQKIRRNSSIPFKRIVETVRVIGIDMEFLQA